MNSTNEKIACKIFGLVTSLFITAMLIILLINTNHCTITSWIAFIVAFLGLVALNVIYINLIENVFRKLNHKN